MDILNRLLLIGSLSMASIASAQDNKDRFTDMDSDGNGTISFAEFSENGPNMASRIDSNADGFLTLEEFMSAGPRRGPGRRPEQAENDDQAADNESREERREKMAIRMTAQFQEMDLDGDDVVSAAEFSEASFLRLDKDNNGALTSEELRPQRGSRGRGRGNRPPRA